MEWSEAQVVAMRGSGAETRPGAGPVVLSVNQDIHPVPVAENQDGHWDPAVVQSCHSDTAGRVPVVDLGIHSGLAARGTHSDLVARDTLPVAENQDTAVARDSQDTLLVVENQDSHLATEGLDSPRDLDTALDTNQGLAVLDSPSGHGRVLDILLIPVLGQDICRAPAVRDIHYSLEN